MPIIIGKPPSQSSGGGTDHTADIAVIKAKDQSQDTLISEVSAKNTEQDTRIDSVEASVLTKADLVSGKVPLAQLPDLPVGRKVSVTNTATRLTLVVHPDITIAYQIDTADAWVLDSGEDPSVEANWDKLGNAQAQGVTAFNSRTGVVIPALGDYTTDMVEPTTNRTYTSPTERTSWNSKVSPEQMDSTISLFGDSLVGEYAPLEDGKVPAAYLPAPTAGGATQGELTRLTAVEASASSADTKANTNALAIIAVQEKNTSQDTRLASIDASLLNKAPLVSGKVPYENLPEFPVGRKVNVADRTARLLLPSYADLTIAYESDTGDAWGLDSNDDPSIEANWSKLGNAQALNVASFNGRTGNIGPQTGDYITDQISETLTNQFVTPEQKTSWTAKETTTGAQTKATAAQTAAVASAKTYADSTFIPASQKNVANGIAPLGSAGKVPAANLLTNVSGGVPLLDSNAKVLVANLPAFLPQKARKWVDVKASRFYNTWWVNSSGNDMEVFLRTNALSDNAKYVIVNMRETSTSTTFGFQSTFDNATGNRYLTHQVTVPAGWQYAVLISGGAVASDISAIGVWRELS